VHVSVSSESELFGISLDYVAIGRRKKEKYLGRSSLSKDPILQFMKSWFIRQL